MLGISKMPYMCEFQYRGYTIHIETDGDYESWDFYGYLIKVDGNEIDGEWAIKGYEEAKREAKSLVDVAIQYGWWEKFKHKA